jgi:hypothetical protein
MAGSAKGGAAGREALLQRELGAKAALQRFGSGGHFSGQGLEQQRWGLTESSVDVWRYTRAAVKRKSDGPTSTTPAGEVRGARGGVLGPGPDRVQCGRVALHQGSMPCRHWFVDHKVVVYWVAAIASVPLPSYVTGLHRTTLH